MLKFVAEHNWYGKGCAENMEITGIAPSTALHVKDIPQSIQIEGG